MFRPLTNFVDAMDGRQRLFAFIMALFVASFGIFYATNGWLAATLVGVGFLTALWITKSIWTPGESTRFRIAKLSLTLVGTVVAVLLKAPDAVQTGTTAQLWEWFGGNGEEIQLLGLDARTLGILVFVLIALVIVNVGGRDREPATGARPELTDPELREKSFQERRFGFCKSLQVELNSQHIETNWSAQWYVPVDAEVETMTRGHRTRRLQELSVAIRRNNRDRVFLVLGDPGSGKSVSLRILCERMLGEVERRRGRIPLYINLKEWITTEVWTRQNPPRIEHLQQFIVANLKRRLDVFGMEFINRYFVRLQENAQFFFVFDSFDEIPALLDVEESGWLIEAFSRMFEAFFSAATPATV